MGFVHGRRREIARLLVAIVVSAIIVSAAVWAVGSMLLPAPSAPEGAVEEPLVAEGAPYVHGIVIDDGEYAPVSGGTIRLFRNVGVEPYRETVMPTQWFGWSLGSAAASYRIEYEHPEYAVEWYEQRRSGGGTVEKETFAIPGDMPVGDIVIHVTKVRATRTATRMPRPSVTLTRGPTETVMAEATETPEATRTPNPAISYFEASPQVRGTLMAHTEGMLAKFVPASCFEIASQEKGCRLAVTEAWVAMVDGECWKFQPFSCAGEDGIAIAARCASPCEVAIIRDGSW